MSRNAVTSTAPGNRRALNAAATREALIAAARAQFAEQGYDAVRLDAVAAAAQATTGAIYHHFGGKRALLLAVGEAVEAEVAAAVRGGAPATPDPWAQLAHACTASLAICSRPEVARIIFREAPGVLGAAEWREVERRYGLGGIERLLARAAAEGTLALADAALAARLVSAALMAAVEAVAEDRTPARLATAEAAMARVLDGFRA
jgi:AcrR family transcriptional regulator